MAVSLVERHAGQMGYEGAGVGRRWKGTRQNNASADVVVGGAVGKLRSRSRDLARNNPQSSRAIRTLVSQMIGTGVIGQPKDQKLRDAWKEWAYSRKADLTEQMNFYGLQKLCMRTIVESGSVLIKKQRVSSKQMLNVPFQLQVLEPDFIDTSRDELIGDNRVKKGIEYNKFGKPIAYYLFEEHPGSQLQRLGQLYKTVRVPAEDVIHCYDILRPGQTDGVPWLHSVLLRLRDYEDYEDAQLLRQKISACFAGFIYDTEAPVNETPTSDDEETKPMSDRFEPGGWEVLPPGKKIEFANPPGVGADFDPYTRRTLQGIAAGAGVTYEQLTQDYSQVNFSSGRMSYNQFYTDLDDWRWNMFIPMLCDRVWEWWTEGYDLATGIPKSADRSIRWSPPRRFMVDPTKEVAASKDMVRSGFTSLSETVRQFGEDPEEHFEEMSQDNKNLDRLGLKLDTDPRTMTSTGQIQSTNTGSGNEPSKAKV